MFASSSSSSIEEQEQAGDSGSDITLQIDSRWQAIQELAEGNTAAESVELTALAAPRKNRAVVRDNSAAPVKSTAPVKSAAPVKKETRAASEFQILLGYALKVLARREHSTVELRRKLGVKASGPMASGCSEEHINQVIEALTLDGSLSDERFVADYLRNRIAKGYGPLRIRMELLERGVPDRLAEEHLTQPSEFWQQQAASVCQRKFGGLLAQLHAESGSSANQVGSSNLEHETDQDAEKRREVAQQRWNRCARFLSQRGFPADLIYRTLDGRLLE